MMPRKLQIQFLNALSTKAKRKIITIQLEVLG